MIVNKHATVFGKKFNSFHFSPVFFQYICTLYNAALILVDLNNNNYNINIPPKSPCFCLFVVVVVFFQDQD